MTGTPCQPSPGRSRGPQAFPLIDANGALRGPFDDFLPAPLVPVTRRSTWSPRSGVRPHPAFGARVSVLVVAGHEGSAAERLAHEAEGRAAWRDAGHGSWTPAGACWTLTRGRSGPESLGTGPAAQAAVSTLITARPPVDPTIDRTSRRDLEQSLASSLAAATAVSGEGRTVDRTALRPR